MSSIEKVGTASALITQNMIEQFLYREARYLDDREFEKWLQCYADDVVYWMPSWDDNDMLVEDPQRDISLIYYANKGGLEDRVFRIRTERSSATSLPEPRTSHNISNVEVIERRGDLVDVRFNWHTMYFRYKSDRPVLRDVVLHDRFQRRAALDPAQDRRAQERLHPPRGGRLPLLGTRDD